VVVRARRRRHDVLIVTVPTSRYIDPVRFSILVALLAFACEREPHREVSEQMDITDLTIGHDHKTQTCVEGDEATCTRAGGRWDGSLASCCLPKASCVSSDETTCTRVKGTWTGTYCCLTTSHPIMEKWSATMAECLESLQQSDGNKIKDRTRDEPEHVSGHLADGRHFACDKMPTTESPGNYFLGYYNLK
jgi:hypothetical protein